LLPNGILPGAKFTLRPSLAFSDIGSVTARHSSSGASAKLCGVVQGMGIRNVRSPVLTITARLRVRRSCIVAEKVASFFTSRNLTKITTTATFSPFAQPAFNRGQPNFFYLKHLHMSYVSVPCFVNLGLLFTKWEFFKLGWCLHYRLHGKCPLYARAFSFLNCCCFKHLYIRQRGHHVVLPCHIILV